MKFSPTFAFLLVSGCCFAAPIKTTHHWFSKVPVNQATLHAKKGHNYKKGYNQKGHGGGVKGQSKLQELFGKVKPK
jgi:hypothetical protein